MEPEEIQELVGNVEERLLEEVEIAKEGVKAANEALAQHINEEKIEDEQKMEEEKFEQEQNKKEQLEAAEEDIENEAIGEEKNP